MKFDNINSDKWQINKSWINLSKKFYTEFKTGLMKDKVGLLN